MRFSICYSGACFETFSVSYWKGIVLVPLRFPSFESWDRRFRGPPGISVGDGTVAGETNPQHCKKKSSISISLDWLSYGSSPVTTWTFQSIRSGRASRTQLKQRFAILSAKVACLLGQSRRARMAAIGLVPIQDNPHWLCSPSGLSRARSLDRDCTMCSAA